MDVWFVVNPLLTVLMAAMTQNVPHVIALSQMLFATTVQAMV
jgi:hypothetical protein